MYRIVRVVCVVVALLMAVSPLLAQEGAKPKEPKAPPSVADPEKPKPAEAKQEKPAKPKPATVAWAPHFVIALKKAEKEGKIMMLYFYGDGSKVCADFEKKSINQPALIELFKKFVCVKLEKNKEMVTAQKYGATSVPRVVFITADEKTVGRVRGPEPAGPFAGKVKEIYESVETEKKARKVLEENPDDLEANLNLGKVHAVRAEYEDALQCMAKVIQGDPQNKKGFLVEAAFTLGRLQYEDDRREEARRSFKKVGRYDTEDKKGFGDDILFALARMEQKDRNYKTALEKFHLFAQKHPESELMHEALYYMGGAYCQNADTKKAIETWEKLVKDYPKSKWVRKAKRFVRQLKERPKKS